MHESWVLQVLAWGMRSVVMRWRMEQVVCKGEQTARQAWLGAVAVWLGKKNGVWRAWSGMGKGHGYWQLHGCTKL